MGDASAVSGLLSVVLGDRMGLYTIELATDEEPYGLTVNFGGVLPDEKEMQGCACLILALTENLSSVQWVSGSTTGGTVDLTAAAELAGKDVKSFGGSPQKVEKLMDKLQLHF